MVSIFKRSDSSKEIWRVQLRKKNEPTYSCSFNSYDEAVHWSERKKQSYLSNPKRFIKIEKYGNECSLSKLENVFFSSLPSELMEDPLFSKLENVFFSSLPSELMEDPLFSKMVEDFQKVFEELNDETNFSLTKVRDISKKICDIPKKHLPQTEKCNL